MKNAMKAMIVLGIMLFLLGEMAGCKEKNEEEEIEELVEKLGDAKTEKEAAEIANKIEKLEQRAKKSAKEVNIKLGQPFTFWNQVETPSDDMTQFSMIFERVAITEEILFGPTEAGKKYLMILAKTKNLGPRESFRASSGRDIQIKTDKGYLYRFQSYPGAFPSTFFSSEPPFPLDWKAFDSWQRPLGGFRTVDRFAESLEPEETGWTIYWTSIPEDSTPVEVFAQWPTEPGRFGGKKRTNFRLKLIPAKKDTPVSKKIPEMEEEKRKLSEAETQLVGKYVGQMADESQVFLEIKPDGTALVSSLIMTWEVIWVPTGDRPYSPTLTLMFYQPSGDSMGLFYHASDGEKAIHIPLDFDSYQVDYWHRRVMDSQEILARQRGADLIKLRKREIEVWSEDKRTICPGEVAIWNKYTSKSGDQETVLELKRIPDFKPAGWKRLTGCEGLGSFYSEINWEISANKVAIIAGGKPQGELGIKGNTLVDEKQGITFMKQSDSFEFLTSAAELLESGTMTKQKEPDSFHGEMIWVKCKNPDCGAEYQMSKRGYFEYVQEHIDPMAMVAPPLVCKKCGKETIYRAEKCGNPDCGIVFFRGTVPNDFADRCPECGHSETEESRRRRALAPKPEKETRAPKADLPRLNFPEAIPIVSVEPNPEAAKLITEAKTFINEKPASIIGARDRLNETLRMPMSSQQRAFVKDQLSKLSDKWLFSKRFFPQDKLCESLQIKPGDQLRIIGQQFKVPYEILMKINNISRPQALQVGAAIKVINGPFHAKIYRSTFRMDLYLQNTFIRSFPVGLGKPGMETSTGLWRVKAGGKLIEPPWPDPVSGKILQPEDPDYALGSRWIGLEGIGGEAEGKTGFGIHGTKDPSQIGVGSTRGSICLSDRDAILLYNLLVPTYSLVKVMDTTKSEAKAQTFYDQAEEDRQRFLAEPEALDFRDKKSLSSQSQPAQDETVAEPVKLYFKELSEQDNKEAERLLNVVVPSRSIGRLPMTGFKLMVDNCRQIIRRWPDSWYAYKAKQMLADMPERYHQMYNITKEETDLSNFYKQRLVGPDVQKHRRLVPLHIELPKPRFVGTPQDPRVPNLEKPLGRPHPPFLAPEGATNVALGKSVSSSDKEPIIGKLAMITDGDKEADSYVELGPFLQHITIDLEAVHEIYSIMVWHYHKYPRVYFDVLVQVADDLDFITNVKTVFNNDIDNSAGLGIGKDMHYTETNEGKLIDTKGLQGRYVRLYSNSNNSNDLNHYVEVSVYGRPVKELDSSWPKPESSSKQELVDALEDLRCAMMKKIQMETDVTAQCFTSVKEHRRAKWLADVLRPVLRVIQGTLSVLSRIGDSTTLSGQVKTSLGNAQYVSEAASLFFMINGLREAGEKLHYAIDGPTYIDTVKEILKAADSTAVVGFDAEHYKMMLEACLESKQGDLDTPLIIARTSELAPDHKPARGAFFLRRIIYGKNLVC